MFVKESAEKVVTITLRGSDENYNTGCHSVSPRWKGQQQTLDIATHPCPTMDYGCSTDCKSVTFGLGWFDSTVRHITQVPLVKSMVCGGGSKNLSH